MSFQKHLKLLVNENIFLENLSNSLKFVNVYCLLRSPQLRNTIDKEKFKENVQENSYIFWQHAKKCLVFGVLSFLCIHACAVNVNLELLESFYFSP